MHAGIDNLTVTIKGLVDTFFFLFFFFTIIRHELQRFNMLSAKTRQKNVFYFITLGTMGTNMTSKNALSSLTWFADHGLRGPDKLKSAQS